MDQPELSQLQKVLKKAGTPWVAEETPISQLPINEKRRRLGYEPGPEEPSLEEQEQAASARAAAGEALAAAVGAPTAASLKEYAGPIRDQGPCGACVAFATLAAAEGTIRTERDDPNLDVDFSEAALFYCAPKADGRPSCSGGWWVAPALAVLRDTGAVDEVCFPYTANDQPCSRCDDWEARATKTTGSRELTSPAEMKRWLADRRGPLVATFAVYDDFFNYRTGIYVHKQGALVGGHAVAAVGYDDNERFWICKNSWGGGWGEAGYFRIGYGEVGIDSMMWGVEGFVARPEYRRVWHEKKTVRKISARTRARTAFLELEGVAGELELASGSGSAFVSMLADVLAAKAAGRPVNAYEDDGVITEIYVL
jgi:C1A family cysteine protease